MGDKMTILKRTTPAVICGLILLLGACATVQELSPSEERSAVGSLIAKLKKLSITSAIAGKELQQAEQNLQHAETAAKKGNDIEARQFTEKARSDAEYAKAKVNAVVYKRQVQQQEEILKEYQERYQ